MTLGFFMVCDCVNSSVTHDGVVDDVVYVIKELV